jgi:hypothetical protein
LTKGAHVNLRQARPAVQETNEIRKKNVIGKLEGKTAVITAATSGMALATAKLFVEGGAYVFITGRPQYL